MKKIDRNKNSFTKIRTIQEAYQFEWGDGDPYDYDCPICGSIFSHSYKNRKKYLQSSDDCIICNPNAYDHYYYDYLDDPIRIRQEKINTILGIDENKVPTFEDILPKKLKFSLSLYKQ
jgi:hypothetical protein